MRKIRNRGRFAQLIGVALGMLTLAIILVSLVLIVSQANRFVFRWAPLFLWRSIFRGRAEESLREAEGERTLRGDYQNLVVSNLAGRIFIEGWKEDYFLVKYKKTGPNLASIDELEVTIEPRGKSLVVAREMSGLNRGSVEFDIYIPAKTSHIAAKSVSGNIELAHMHERVQQELKTVSGGISTDRCDDLNAESTSGTIGFLFSGERLSVKTVSGSIRGSFRNVKPGGRMDLSSVSGSVTLSVDEGYSAEFSLHSISGSIHCDLPISLTREERGHLEGKIRNGSSTLSVKTTSGAIKIEKL